MYVGDVGIGEIFRYDGALFIVLDYDEDMECYPNLCIAMRNMKYDNGEKYNFDYTTEIDELITSKKLKDFIPKSVDNDME